jgi:hypothetical protein
MYRTLIQPQVGKRAAVVLQYALTLLCKLRNQQIRNTKRGTSVAQNAASQPEEEKEDQQHPFLDAPGFRKTSPHSPIKTVLFCLFFRRLKVGSSPAVALDLTLAPSQPTSPY